MVQGRLRRWAMVEVYTWQRMGQMAGTRFLVGNNLKLETLETL